MNRITFTREGVNHLKKMILEAIAKGYYTFMNKGSLVDIRDAQRLIDRFEPSFKDSSVMSATINYDF